MKELSTRMRGRSVLLGLILGTCGLTAGHTQVSLPQKQLVPTNYPPGAARPGFGETVSILGGRALVAQVSGGVVSVFEQSGGKWTNTQQIQTPLWDIERGKGMGDVIVQDANSILTSDVHYGYVYYFERGPTSGLFKPKAILRSSTFNQFGTALAMEGCKLMASAMNVYPGTPWPGRIHLYNRCSGSVAWTGTIYSPKGVDSHDEFGRSIALSGNELMVGAPYDSSAAGAVYYYTYNGSAWVLKQTILQPFGGVGYRFGTALSFRNGLAVIGAPGQSDVGRTEVFKRTSAGTWQWVSSLVQPSYDGTTWGFGTKVIVTPDRVLVGTEYVPLVPGFNSTLYLFKRVGDTLQYELQLKADPSHAPAPNRVPSGYASSFDVAGRSLIVGEPEIPQRPGNPETPGTGEATVLQLPP